MGHGPGAARVPALAGDEVADVAPVDAVGPAAVVGVVDRAAAVGPVGVEVAVGGALARLGRALTLVGVQGRGEGSGRASEADEEGGECDHCGRVLLIWRWK